MATCRMISRDFFTSADLTDLPWWGQLLFAGMIVFADDAGVIRADTRYLRNLILTCIRPRKRPSLTKVELVLDQLVTRKCLASDQLEGVSCYRITNFAQFQRLKRREGKRSEEKRREEEAAAPSVGGSIVTQEAASEGDLLEVYAFEFKLGRPYAGAAILRLKPTMADVVAWREVRESLGPKRFRWAIQQFKNPDGLAKYRKDMAEETRMDPSSEETADDRRSAVMRKRTLEKIRAAKDAEANAVPPPPEFYEAIKRLSENRMHS